MIQNLVSFEDAKKYNRFYYLSAIFLTIALASGLFPFINFVIPALIAKGLTFATIMPIITLFVRIVFIAWFSDVFKSSLPKLLEAGKLSHSDAQRPMFYLIIATFLNAMTTYSLSDGLVTIDKLGIGFIFGLFLINRTFPNTVFKKFNEFFTVTSLAVPIALVASVKFSLIDAATIQYFLPKLDASVMISGLLSGLYTIFIPILKPFLYAAGLSQGQSSEKIQELEETVHHLRHAIGTKALALTDALFSSNVAFKRDISLKTLKIFLGNNADEKLIYLKSICNELIANAARHGKDEPLIEITDKIKDKDKGTFIKITVANKSQNKLTADDIENIKNYIHNGKEGRQGIGILKRATQNLQAEYRVAEMPPKGYDVAVEVLIPISASA